MPSRRVLLHNSFLNPFNFRTIKISQAKSGWKGLRTLESYEVASALVRRPLAIGLVVT